MLEGLLTPGAGALYDTMVRTGPLALDDPRAESPEMRELFDRGFVRRDYREDPVIAPMEPVRAVDHAILGAQQQLLEQQRQIVAARQQLDVLQAVYRAANGAGGDSAVEVLTDPRRIGSLSLELCLSAREEFLTFTTHHFKRKPDAGTVMRLPEAVTERGVALRNVYERAALEFEGAKEVVDASVKAGWTMRVASELPMKMVIADRHSALVPLDPSGMEGALFIRSPTIVAALRMLFELVWSQAVAVHGPASRPRHGLTPTQAKVLDLLATGMTDGAIARHLDVSERTVRRHVQGLLEALQADNRVAAVFAATRLGWLG
ncbi:regulatory protein, luxR family [Amycolatopsis pretoriensis]|uniref:Regulatory protein, luxR family n=1 Tax=Amycolatopsis pretoriensis TaxID=218821 RepID=A0A1H5QIT0_9PSEU|nr:LuxR C-terminal-related transcriptional regulator [Amycolatopsis pretoriensis]SEF25976.1 regulatory protein, luxR family [Amycolatopsis pretoriensis]